MLAQCGWTVRTILRSCVDPDAALLKREERFPADLQPLGRSHAELYVKQVAASGIADSQDGRVFQLPLR